MARKRRRPSGSKAASAPSECSLGVVRAARRGGGGDDDDDDESRVRSPGRRGASQTFRTARSQRSSSSRGGVTNEGGAGGAREPGGAGASRRGGGTRSGRRSKGAKVGKVELPRSDGRASTTPAPPRNSEPPSARGRMDRRRRRRRGGGGGDDSQCGDGDEMEEVMAQLKRQRAAAAAAAEARRLLREKEASDGSAAAAGRGDGSSRAAGKGDEMEASAPAPPPKRMGNYVYDPARGRYFPECEVGRASSPSSAAAAAAAAAAGGAGEEGGDDAPPIFLPTATPLSLSRRNRSLPVSLSAPRCRFAPCALSSLPLCPSSSLRRFRIVSDTAGLIIAGRARIVLPSRSVEDMRAEENYYFKRRERSEVTRKCRHWDGGNIDDDRDGSMSGTSSGGESEDDRAGDEIQRDMRRGPRRLRCRCPSPSSRPPSAVPPAAAVPGLSQLSAHWRSILPPLVANRRLTADSFVRRPLDVYVKAELHPSARTFDVLPHESDHCRWDASSGGNQSEWTPHVVTISTELDEEGNASGYQRVMYRESREGPYAAYEMGANAGRGSGSARSAAAQDVHHLQNNNARRRRRFHSVRFVPPVHCGGEERGVLVATLSKSALNDWNVLVLNRVGGGRSGDADRGGTVLITAELPDAMNDMAFSPSCAQGRAPAHVALAPQAGQDGETPLRFCFVDLHTMRAYSCAHRNRWRRGGNPKPPNSDALCVEYLDDEREDVVLYGHRSGDVTIYDSRAGTSCYVRAPRGNADSGLGSVSSLLTFQGREGAASARSWNVLARGSLGTLRLFDIRRLGGESCAGGFGSSGGGGEGRGGYFSSGSSMPSLEMRPPADVHGAMTTRCTGMALDPSGTLVLSPYARRDRSLRLGLWSVLSGRMVGDVTLASSGEPRAPLSLSSTDPMLPVSEYRSDPVFCELSPTVTRGWDYGLDHSSGDDDSDGRPVVRTRKGSWGLWMKCSRQLEGAFRSSNGPQLEAGGIHHIAFPAGLGAT